MCTAYPAQVLEVLDADTATVALPDRTQRVLLTVLTDDPPVLAGEWLLVQSGIALARLDPTEAAARRALLQTLTGGQL